MIKQIVQTTAYKLSVFGLRLYFIYILAHVLTPSDYGAYSIITTTYTFLLLLSGLNLSTYLSRVVPGLDKSRQMEVFKTTFLFEVGCTIVLVALLMSSEVIKPILTIIHLTDHQQSFILGLLLLIMSIACTELTTYLWAQKMITHSNRIDFIAQALWVLPLIILWHLDQPITLPIILIVNVVGILLGITYGFTQIKIREWWRAKFNIKILGQALLCGVPLIIPAVSVTALRSGDRYILSAYHNLADVGLYSFAFSFLNTLYTFSATVILNNMAPYIIEAHNLHDLQRRNRILLQSLQAALGVFIFGVLILMSFSAQIIELVARPEYTRAGELFPLLAIGTINIIISSPAHTLLFVQNRMMLLMWIDLCCFLLGLALSFILIPRYSYFGAAWTMLTTFGLMAALKVWYSKLWREINLLDLFLLRAPWQMIKQAVKKSAHETL